jgi:arsenical pump membrane protein
VLVAALLLVGQVADRCHLFDAAGAALARVPGPPALLLLACLGLDAVVTALLNLDTAVVFMTPVLLVTARRRGLDTGAFLYGSVFMANASSLFLPGSNLTNLLVLSGPRGPQVRPSGASFLAHMLGFALPACLFTAAGLLVLHRRSLMSGAPHSERRNVEPSGASAAPLQALAVAGVLCTAALIVVLSNPALPVLTVALALLALSARAGRVSGREAISRLGLPSLLGLFLLAVALGTLARATSFPASVLHSAGAPLTAAVAALASILVNNLPAAVLLSARGHLHLGALLLGLNVGPNLAVTGSLSVLLWWRTARAMGERPSASAYSRQGIPLAALALAAALLIGGS